MGKSAARRSPAPADDNPPAARPLEDPAADAAIAATREQLTKPPKTTIHRDDPETGERKFCATVLTEIATEDYIARKFGPGKFRLTHRRAGDDGAYKYDSADTVIVDERAARELEQLHDDVDDAPDAPPGTTVVPAGGNILERAMEAGVLRLLEQSARQNDLTIAMIERIRKDSGSSVDWVALIVALAPVVKEMLGSRKDPTETAVLLAKMLTDKNGGANNVEQLTTMFERGIKLAERFGGDRGGGDSIMPIVGEGVKVLGGIVEAVVAERRAARGADPAAPPANTPPLALVPNVAEPEPASPHVPDRLWISVARPQLPMLLAAARFMPAGAAAETIAANLTPPAFDDLIADIEDTSDPGFAGRLVAIFPQAADLRPQWFQELLRELLDMAGPGDEPNETPARAAVVARK